MKINETPHNYAVHEQLKNYEPIIPEFSDIQGKFRPKLLSNR